MEKQFVFVNGDDWCGLYFNGRLLTEGHNLRAYEIFEAILENGGKVTRFNEVEPDMDWLGELGSLPSDLRDVKLIEPGIWPAGLVFPAYA